MLSVNYTVIYMGKDKSNEKDEGDKKINRATARGMVISRGQNGLKIK